MESRQDAGDGSTPLPPPRGPSPTADDTNAPLILGVSGLLMGLSFTIVALRIWVRQVVIKTMGVDDSVMIVALIAAIGSMVCFVGECRNGAGKHFWDVDMARFPDLLRWQYVHGLLLVTGISAVKVSVALFLLRLIQGKWYRRFIIGTVVFLALFTVSCLCTLIFQCVPPRVTFMLPRPAGARCFDNSTFTKIGTFNGSINVITDVLYVVFPIPMVLKLQINLRTKLSLIFALSLGLFACIAAILRVYLGAHIFENLDFTWANAFFLWNTAELHAGILAASIPTLRPLFRSLLGNPSRHICSHGYQAYGGGIDGPSVYGGGARNYAKGTTTTTATTHGASSLSSVASSPGRRGRRLRRHRHRAAAIGADPAYPSYGRYGDEAHAIGLVSVARGSKWDMVAEAVDGAGAGTAAFGYDARVTAATTAKGGGGVSDDGDAGSSEDGVLLPAPPRMAITKRTDVVVMR